MYNIIIRDILHTLYIALCVDNLNTRYLILLVALRVKNCSWFFEGLNLISYALTKSQYLLHTIVCTIVPLPYKS